MKLPQLLRHHLPNPDFAKYFTSFQPPLDLSHLKLDPVVGGDREKLKAILEGDHGIMLRYKGREGALTSIDEEENGEIWRAFHVTGARSKKSFRVASGLHWPNLLGDSVNELANHPESEVRHIVMPPMHGVTNLDGAASEHVDSYYRRFRSALGMTFSKEAGLFIRDIKR